ncbi:protein O-mannosyl-transferase family [candidate division KSB1 bacterium]
MESYRRVNNILGWLIFAIASTVYIVTSEPTASLWDCGEYITTAYKLEVGHPPGAPFFQLLGRFFSLFAFGNVALVARMINTMSALSSGFTVLFLFWSITMLAKKLVQQNAEMNKDKMFAVFGSAIVGSLAYTFSDSFWFSAVEGEVYAMSSFFTAIVFWAILKWEEVADDKYAYRWLILISYLVGLSIGVHLLNLLTIPAIVFVYYFKKFKPSRKGVIIALLFSFILLGSILFGIIPLIVKLSGLFELFFVNTIGLPFNTGTIIYFLLLIGGIIWGINYTVRKGKMIMNTIIISFIFLLIGYSTFFLLVIRSNADPPIDENNPEDAVSLLAYLKREQYGQSPLIHGHYYNAPEIERKDGSPVYVRDNEKGKYVITDNRKKSIPVYDPKYTTIFPRMWNNQDPSYIKNYKSWSGIENDPDSKKIPTFGQNLRYFFSYQLGFMYFRYFMWNFAGRQNDIQNRGSTLDGNWISGIKFLDNWRLGPQDNIPSSKKNKGTNKYYLLPLLLGLIGFFFHLNKNSRDTLIVGLIFFMTGIAIVIYLNQKAYEPRERDYAFAASFYAFAIWIGLGVLGIYDYLRTKLEGKLAAILTTLVTLLLVPGIMAMENWDDHNRSGKYATLDAAWNYLNSCAPNAILFTNGDNDTFPLWYAQEVEGIRTDVRVVNLSLLSTEWYIDQMKRKAYDSDPVPFSFTKEQYRAGTRDIVPFDDQNKRGMYVDVKQVIDFVKDDRYKLRTRYKNYNYIPTKKFRIPVDSSKVVDNGTVPPELADQIVPVDWEMNYYAIQKNKLMQLDLLASFKWDMPVYFAITTGNDAYIGLEDYFQLEGMTYRLIPIKTENKGRQIGRINTDILYDNIMNKFKWRSLNDPKIYLSDDNIRMTMNFRNNFGRLAGALIEEGKLDSAIKVCDRCMEVIPDESVPFNYFIMPIAEAYQRAGAADKSYDIIKRMYEITEEELEYYFSYKGDKVKQVKQEISYAMGVLQNCVIISISLADDFYKQEAIEKGNKIIMKILDEYQHYLIRVYKEEDSRFLLQRLIAITESNGQIEMAEDIKRILGAGIDVFNQQQSLP